MEERIADNLNSSENIITTEGLRESISNLKTAKDSDDIFFDILISDIDEKDKMNLYSCLDYKMQWSFSKENIFVIVSEINKIKQNIIKCQEIGPLLDYFNDLKNVFTESKQKAEIFLVFKDRFIQIIKDKLYSTLPDKPESLNLFLRNLLMLELGNLHNSFELLLIKEMIDFESLDAIETKIKHKTIEMHPRRFTSLEFKVPQLEKLKSKKSFSNIHNLIMSLGNLNIENEFLVSILKTLFKSSTN